MKHITIIFTLITLLFLAACLKTENVTTGTELKALASEATTSKDSFELFQLWNDCKPMGLLIGAVGSPQNITYMRFLEEVQTVALTSLRASGLFDETSGQGLTLLEQIGTPVTVPYLHIEITQHESDSRFSILIEYAKMLQDNASQTRGVAVTWETGLTESYGKDQLALILNRVVLLTEEFIKEYQRVNEDACAHR